jgi:hypothetical protein
MFNTVHEKIKHQRQIAEAQRGVWMPPSMLMVRMFNFYVSHANKKVSMDRCTFGKVMLWRFWLLCIRLGFRYTFKTKIGLSIVSGVMILAIAICAILFDNVAVIVGRVITAICIILMLLMAMYFRMERRGKITEDDLMFVEKKWLEIVVRVLCIPGIIVFELFAALGMIFKIRAIKNFFTWWSKEHFVGKKRHRIAAPITICVWTLMVGGFITGVTFWAINDGIIDVVKWLGGSIVCIILFFIMVACVSSFITRLKNKRLRKEEKHAQREANIHELLYTKARGQLREVMQLMYELNTPGEKRTQQGMDEWIEWYIQIVESHYGLGGGIWLKVIQDNWTYMPSFDGYETSALEDEAITMALQHVQAMVAPYFIGALTYQTPPSGVRRFFSGIGDFLILFKEMWVAFKMGVCPVLVLPEDSNLPKTVR